MDGTGVVISRNHDWGHNTARLFGQVPVRHRWRAVSAWPHLIGLRCFSGGVHRARAAGSYTRRRALLNVRRFQPSFIGLHRIRWRGESEQHPRFCQVG